MGEELEAGLDKLCIWKALQYLEESASTGSPIVQSCLLSMTYINWGNQLETICKAATWSSQCMFMDTDFGRRVLQLQVVGSSAASKGIKKYGLQKADKIPKL